jgi:hypothetical protein
VMYFAGLKSRCPSVGSVDGIANLRSVLQGLRKRQWPLEGHAFNELHHQIVRPDIVQAADVGVVQRSDDAGDGSRFARDTDPCTVAHLKQKKGW